MTIGRTWKAIMTPKPPYGQAELIAEHKFGAGSGAIQQSVYELAEVLEKHDTRTVVLRTMKAKENCRITPQITTLLWMADRFV